jgi:ABC-type transport system involved in multi-copper enzyme maturation permease subunit
MGKSKGRPFLELFASALHEDYRFPLLEVFAFLYALSTFALAGVASGIWYSSSEEAIAYNLVSILTGLPLFIFIIMVFKNIAYGFGSDLEKGTIQTLLSYPLKRYAILTAKLLSAIGVALTLFFGIQLFALFVLAPDIIVANFGVVILSYAASLSYPLFLSGVILIATMILKRGGLAIVVGVVLYFVMGVVSAIVMFIALATNSAVALQTLSFINPSIALQNYYGAQAFLNRIWAPSYFEVITYVCGSYVIVFFVLFLAYLYFCRRLGF